MVVRHLFALALLGTLFACQQNVTTAAHAQADETGIVAEEGGPSEATEENAPPPISQTPRGTEVLNPANPSGYDRLNDYENEDYRIAFKFSSHWRLVVSYSPETQPALEDFNGAVAGDQVVAVFRRGSDREISVFLTSLESGETLETFLREHPVEEEALRRQVLLFSDSIVWIQAPRPESPKETEDLEGELELVMSSVGPILSAAVVREENRQTRERLIPKVEAETPTPVPAPQIFNARSKSDFKPRF